MTMQATIAQQRRAKAAHAWAMHNKHPLGSSARDAYLREHGQWINAAQRAESGDLRPVAIA